MVANHSTNEIKESHDWQSKVAAKQDELRAAIPPAYRLPQSLTSTLSVPLEIKPNNLLNIPRESGILTEREIYITEENTVAELLSKLASGELSALETTIAFCKRAAIAQQLTSCLTEIFFDDAVARARYLDQLRIESKKSLAPLHGLPISLKDSFQLVGKEATIGYVANLGKKSVKNSPMITILLDLGAVLYVKTNVPMSLMTGDSHNNIFGRTLNPHNSSLTAGGSSGGEGALIALRGSPLGVGTDLAGSIRIPAACCGIYGFKPTASRVPYGGQAGSSLRAFKEIRSCAGPMSNDLESLEIFCKAVIDSRPAVLDASVIDVPWRPLTGYDDKARLRLGILPEEHLYPWHPPMKRALAEAIKRLETQGHEIIWLDPSETRISESNDIGRALHSIRVGITHADDLVKESGEPLVPSVALRQVPVNTQNYKSVVDLAGMEEIKKLQTLISMRKNLIQDWRDLWSRHKLDAIISPSSQNTAVPHDTYLYAPYTNVFNFLDYPACVVPFLKVSKEEDSTPLKMQPDQRGTYYEPDRFIGAPCSISIATTPFRDEECLQIAKVVNACLQ